MFRLKNPTHTVLLVGAATALLTMAGAGSASAAPVSFTWNPNAIPGITTTDPQQFTADDITTAAYGSIVLGGAGPGTFTASGIVNLSAFTLNGADALPPGSTLGAGNSALFGTGYVLYATYQASGTTTATSLPTTTSTITSPITSFNYQLFLAPANSSAAPTFVGSAAGASVSGIGTAVELATGSEITNGYVDIDVYGRCRAVVRSQHFGVVQRNPCGGWLLCCSAGDCGARSVLLDHQYRLGRDDVGHTNVDRRRWRHGWRRECNLPARGCAGAGFAPPSGLRTSRPGSREASAVCLNCKAREPSTP